MPQIKKVEVFSKWESPLQAELYKLHENQAIYSVSPAWC